MAKRRASAAQRAALARGRATAAANRARRAGGAGIGAISAPLDLPGFGREYTTQAEEGFFDVVVKAASNIVDDFGNLISVLPVVGKPAGEAVKAVGEAVTGAAAAVTGAAPPTRRGPGRPKAKRVSFEFLKGTKIGKGRKKRLLALGAPNVHKGAFGRVMINPLGGSGVVGLVSAALGAGAGYVLAQKIVPETVGRYVPGAATGVAGLAVGALGGLLVGKLVGKYSKSTGSRIAVGSLAALGVGLVGLVLQRVPSQITSKVGLSDYLQLSGMDDYLRLSGPVPAGLLSDYAMYQSQEAGAAGAAASQATTAWAPGAEQF